MTQEMVDYQGEGHTAGCYGYSCRRMACDIRSWIIADREARTEERLSEWDIGAMWAAGTITSAQRAQIVAGELVEIHQIDHDGTDYVMDIRPGRGTDRP